MGNELVVFRLLAEHEGIEPLVMLLGDNNSQCRLYAARCITEMSSHGNQNMLSTTKEVEFLIIYRILTCSANY